MPITEWLNYYKRVTFLSVHMPGHCREFGSFPEPMPVTKKDLPDLASINPHDPGIWAHVLITEWLNYYKRVTFFDRDRYCFFPEFQIISGTHARDQEGLA